MIFPKQELYIDNYLKDIKILLEDESCHIFIDTNIISQFHTAMNQIKKVK